MTRYYHFQSPQQLTQHFTNDTRTVQDTADEFGSERDMAELRVRARVQSGDYLVTLITELERLAAGMSDTPEASALADYVSELTYVDNHYKLTKRPHQTT